MQLDTALPWLALCLPRGIAARLLARLLKQFGSPEDVFRAPLRQLEACELPSATAQAIVKREAFKRAEKELAAIRAIPGCMLLNWSEPEYPQTLLQIYDPPVLFYVRGDAQILNLPSLAMVGTRRPTLYGTQMADRLAYVGTLASGLAHEIRNPLNAMNMNLQMLDEEMKAANLHQDPEATALLASTKGEVRRLENLVNWAGGTATDPSGLGTQAAGGLSLLLVLALVGIVLVIVLWAEILLRNSVPRDVKPPAELPKEVREVVTAQAVKRVGFEFVERRRASWDHRKLGGLY